MTEIKEAIRRELKSTERSIAEETAKMMKAEAKVECYRDTACLLRELVELIEKEETANA